MIYIFELVAPCVLFWFVVFSAIGERRYGAARAWVTAWWAALLMVGVLPVIGLLGTLTAPEPDHWFVVVQLLSWPTTR